MPLLKRQPFRKQKPPEDLGPEEELFYCKLTKEIFRDYEEFFARVILCNSLVWTCELTGRPGLTYAEALNSEKRAQNVLKTFPVPLKRPILYLGNLTKRGRLVDMCDDVFGFAKDRYFIGEEVEALIENQKINSYITKVIPPSSDEIDNSPKTVHSSPETSSSIDDSEKKKSFGPDPSLFKYEVKTNEKETHVVPAASIIRKKGQFSKEKIKLFLKQYFEPKDNLWKLQEMFNKKYNISSMKFTDIFAGPLPCFEKTIGKKNSPHPSTTKADSPETATKNKTPNEGKTHPKVGKKEKDASQTKKEITIEDVEELRRTFEERRRLKEEEKMKKKAEKEKERERLREERRIQMEQLKEWLKPRDDLECDDLKDIPVPTAVQCSIPNELFGKALMILEYLHIFGHLFRIKDTFSQGFTFELLEKCLLEKDVQGPLGDVLQFLLQAIFNLQASEENVSAVISESIDFLDLDEDTDGNVARILQAAKAVSMWPQKHQGLSLQKLPLDCYTLTEILRLHLLTLGGQAANTSWQQQVKGSYSVRDDPALELRLKDPNLIKALGTHSVFDLNPAERLQLMEVLINQLLTFLTVREHIEEKLEKAKVARMELKQFQWAEQRREKEEAALFKSKILNLQQSEKEENVTPDEKTPVLEVKQESESPTNGLTIKMKERNEAYLQRKRENYLRKEQELIETVNKLQSGGAIQPLGRDRAYRRFWTFTSIPGLFVEDDDDLIGTCLPEPTPYNPNGNPYSQLNGASEYHKHSKMNGQLTSDKENKIIENQTTPTNDSSITYNKKHKLLSDNHPTVVLERINHVASFKEEPVMASEASNNKLQIFGMCTASPDHCPVHGKIRNQNKIYWSFYCTSTEVDDLITCLNPRGYREGPLRETLLQEKQRIVQSIEKCPVQKLNSEKAATLQIQDVRKSNRLNYTTPLVISDIHSEEMMESALREMILDIEERLYAGSLGWIKIPDRNAWREAILNRSYASQCESLKWGRNKGKSCENISENGRITPLDSSYQEVNNQRTFSPLPVSQSVKDMAAALLQIAQSIEPKYIQRPLGENDEDRKQRLKSIEELEKKMRDENSENSETKKEMLQKLQSPNNVMEMWEESLMSSTSFSQIFLHLATLEHSIAWSRSALNAKCRLCRRMGDAENMLLCDGCNRGHHTYCLKPPLKEIPEGDWFCKDCKPRTEIPLIFKNVSVVISDIDESSKQTMSDTANDPDYDDEMEKTFTNDDSESSNADTCDVCDKGGHLICCDYCPLSFHMGCVDPPLKKVPRGRWECPHCSQVTPRTRRKRPSDVDACESPAKRTRSRDKPPAEEEDEIWMSGRKKQGPPNRRGASRDVPVDYKLCDQVLVELCRHECSWPFLRPVKQKEAPHYYEIIKRPIDLATMRKKLSNMEYRATRDFLADIFLLMQNCMMYNAVDSPEYIAATGLLEFVEKLVQHLGYVDLDDLLYQACQNVGSPVSSENSSQDKHFNKSSLRYS